MEKRSEMNEVIDELNDLLVTVDASGCPEAAKLAVRYLDRIDAAMYSYRAELLERLQAVCPHEWCGSVKDHIKAKCEICGELDWDRGGGYLHCLIP